MSYPTDPKSIAVRDRVITVLRAIVQGNDYFFTSVVFDNWKHFKEILEFPSYEVYFGPSQPLQHLSGGVAQETFTLIVHGRIQSDDPPGDVRRAIQDVRRALLADRINGAAGALSSLLLTMFVGASQTDNGEEAEKGFGWFNQEFICTMYGAVEDL
jgi:hypothetical protein